MTLGLLQDALGGRRLGTAGSEPSPPKSPAHAASIRQQAIFGLGGGVLLLVLLGIGMATGVLPITAEHVTEAYTYVLLAIAVGFFGWLFFLAGDWDAGGAEAAVSSSACSLSRRRSSGLCSNRLDSTLNLFADRSTRQTLVPGYGVFPSSWWQSVNAHAHHGAGASSSRGCGSRLGHRQPASPTKFALGLDRRGARLRPS